MSEPIASHLDELEAATREYAQYSQGALGLAWLVGSGYVVAAVLFSSAARADRARWAPVLAMPALALWLLTVRVARRCYQRAGTVSARPEIGPRWRRFNLAVVYVQVVRNLLELAHAGFPGEAVPLAYWVAWALTLALIPGILALADRTLRGLMDWGLVFLAFIVSQLSFPGLSFPFEEHGLNNAQRLALRICFGALPLFVAAALAWTGVTQHRAYRRLQRRLEVLRLPEPAPSAPGVEGERP